MSNIIREEISIVDYLNVTAVKSGNKIKRYEIRPASEAGFYRISTDTVEKGVIYFPGKMDLEDILADIRKVDTEE